MKVLILNGPAESGKGTVVEYIEEFFNITTYIYSSIDYVKQVAKKAFDWNGKKDVAGRNLLAGIKQLMISYNDIPTKKIIATIIEAELFDVALMVVDIREPDEIEKLVNHCKKIKMSCTTCLVLNQKAEKEAKKKGLSLTGDRLYGKYDYDITIDNKGSLDELRETVHHGFNHIFNEGSHLIGK